MSIVQNRKCKNSAREITAKKKMGRSTVSCNFHIYAGPSDTVGTQISFQGNQAVLAFTAMQNLTLNITGKTLPGIDDTNCLYLALQWWQASFQFQAGSTEEVPPQHFLVTDP